MGHPIKNKPPATVTMNRNRHESPPQGGATPEPGLGVLVVTPEALRELLGQLFAAWQRSLVQELRTLLPDKDEFISAQGVADLLDLEESTIRRWANSNRFPEPVRISSRQLRWRRGDILEWAAQQKEARHA